MRLFLCDFYLTKAYSGIVWYDINGGLRSLQIARYINAFPL